MRWRSKKCARPTDEKSLEEQNEAEEKRRKQNLEERELLEYEMQATRQETARRGARRARYGSEDDIYPEVRERDIARRQAKKEKAERQARREQAEAAGESVEESETDSIRAIAHKSHNGNNRKPVIDLGEYGYTPRWIVEPASPQSQLMPHDDITVQPPTESLSARNSPSSPKMATLVWKFEPGYKERWDGLTEEELHEYAYKFLKCAMRNPKFRDRFRGHILCCSHAHLVADVEDCLPPLPEPPATDLLGELKFSGPFRPHPLPLLDSPEPKGVRYPMFSNAGIKQDENMMGRRIQGLDGTCDLPPLPNGLPPGPIPLEDFKGFMGVGQTFDMPGYGLPGGLPPANQDKLFRQHAKTKITKPRKGLPDTGRRQYATKTVAGKHPPTGNAQDNDDDDSDYDDDKPKPEPFKFAEAHRRHLKDRDFRDKVMPMRTFRRMRPWAGARISKAYINEDDLSQLSRFPSAERAFAPRIGVKASTGPLSNRATAPPTVSNGATTSSGSKAVRRNPRRTARNK